MMLSVSRRKALALLGSVPIALGAEPRWCEADTGQTTHSILDHVPAALHAAIRNGTGTTDLTRYYDAAFAAHPAIMFPAGTYTHRSYAIPAGCSILTEGTTTVFRQLPDAAPLDPLFLVKESGIRIGGCVLQGLIALFDHADRKNGHNSEFNHGILIRASADGPAVQDVTIGDIVGRDIRGDVIAIACLTGGRLQNIEIDHVFGDNVLRNGVSIVGGRNISIAGIDGKAFGYTAFDIEPEGAYSEPVADVHVGSLRGAVVQIAATPDCRIERVTINRLDTDPAYAANCDPPYRNAQGQVLLDTGTGLRLRNATAVQIGHHRARGHGVHAIAYQGDPVTVVQNPTLRIDEIDYAAIGRSERVYKALVLGTSLRSIIVNGGNVTMTQDDQRLILGNPDPDGTRCRISKVTSDGMIVAYATDSTLLDIHMVTSSPRGFAMGLRNSTIGACRIEASFLGYNLTNCRIEKCRFVLSKNGQGVLIGQHGGTVFRSTTVIS